LESFESLLLLLAAMILVVSLGRRVRVPYPILLVLAGLVLAALPGIPHFELEPELVLVVFLPPLLFSAAYVTPFRDFRANRRPIALLAVGLPLFTVALVVLVVRLFVPDSELPLAAAVALGAIVAPTDAIAATSIFRQLGAPRRLVVVLEGESLVNDAISLVMYRTAVAAIGSTFVLADAVGGFAVAAVGGSVLGLVVGVAATELFRRLDDPPVEVAVSLIVPFAAYLPAEHLGLSGVLAAVVAGLYVGRHSSRVLGSDTRILAAGVWQILTFMLNGFAFLLVGLQLRDVMSAVSTRPPGELAMLAIAVSAAVVVARLVWVYPATYLPRRLVRSIARNDPAPARRVVFTLGWSGMRGVVSLAAALALPATFPQRDLLILLTYVVILVTLVGQGLSLPVLLRRLGVVAPTGVDDEEVLARAAATEAALREVAELRVAWPGHAELIDQIEASYRHRAEHLPVPERAGLEGVEDLDQELIEHQAIRRSIIAAQRNAAIELRDRGTINDEVLRTLERELDLEELRMEA
jgi:CPA1 family monovalent cation:H+ antiporter